MHSRKYPRTYHFPFSPGTTSDDRIAKSYDGLLDGPIVITEKLDGENTCLNGYGVFARSHAAPTRNPWASYLWDTWNTLHKGLGDLELFGESLYAVHSIRYGRLESYYYLFAIREGDRWLAWDEVQFYAGVLGLPTVPVLYRGRAADLPGDDRLPAAEKSRRSSWVRWRSRAAWATRPGKCRPAKAPWPAWPGNLPPTRSRPAYSSGCARATSRPTSTGPATGSGQSCILRNRYWGLGD
jgi:hypothetical protein